MEQETGKERENLQSGWQALLSTPIFRDFDQVDGDYSVNPMKLSHQCFVLFSQSTSVFCHCNHSGDW